ncbi:hypothetical protein BRO54_0769 [Geobacillus proteiniphilus]|uniref:DUF3870 domain-containing protein n=2 Tax=Geobacillus proteiniphilus TaxID=860353 RepID=A0A1Q5T6C2_9BACL|nr:hypothetical protein BRO54_0769 [Geobacillus proteiniphilus]
MRRYSNAKKKRYAACRVCLAGGFFSLTAKRGRENGCTPRNKIAAGVTAAGKTRKEGKRMKTQFIAGHARLPAGMAAKSLYDTLTITAEIDKKYGVIVEASCTLATEHGRDYVARLLRGHSLRDGIDGLLAELDEGYLGKAHSALCAALKDLYKQYCKMEEKES